MLHVTTGSAAHARTDSIDRIYAEQRGRHSADMAREKAGTQQRQRPAKARKQELRHETQSRGRLKRGNSLVCAAAQQMHTTLWHRELILPPWHDACLLHATALLQVYCIGSGECRKHLSV